WISFSCSLSHSRKRAHTHTQAWQSALTLHEVVLAPGFSRRKESRFGFFPTTCFRAAGLCCVRFPFASVKKR
uniref:Uncharacterized protein n=1 Tax=Anopheles quadriannulatus TaxID=34691 RepID=A0A182XRH8_ANOQN